jgi:hypothetical protein
MPRTVYYWDTGSWHSAYNAASYYSNDSELPPLRRQEAWKASIRRGRAFLERGIRNNPDNWSLWSQLGFLLSDYNKFGAFADSDATFLEASEAYRKAQETGKSPPYVGRAAFYSLARVKGKEAEALTIARSLYAEKRNHTPTLKALLLVLEAHQTPEMDPTQRAIEIFGTPEKAYEALTGHWQRTRERFPVYGVAAGLEGLERQLGIPPENSIFSRPLPPPSGPSTWFSK